LQKWWLLNHQGTFVSDGKDLSREQRYGKKDVFATFDT
jgi:hypothetical protein